MSVLNRISKTQKAQLQKALTNMAEGNHKTTGVKLEMEAHFSRRYRILPECDECSGTGYNYCGSCDEGEVYNSATSSWDECAYCGGDNRQNCEDCNGTGLDQSEGPQRNWGNDMVCQEFVLESVPKSARDAVKYIRVYVDGSVDTECTVTVPVDKAYVLIHFIEAWKKLGEAIGNGMEIHKAGMHISVLNDPECFYSPGSDRDNNALEAAWADNFARSMTPLLPALYFLASPSQQSRGLNYRRPCIDPSKGGAYPAICTHHNTTIEYRIFETCYDKPLMLIDFLIVISKTLQFYGPTFIDTSMKLGELGVPDGQGVDRFYFTVKHLQALDRGLKWLKPDYKSIEQLKAERDFKVTRVVLRERQLERVKQWRDQYGAVKKERYNQRMSVFHEGMRQAYENAQYDPSLNPREYAKRYLKDWMNSRGIEMQGNLRDYLRYMANQYHKENSKFVINV